MSRVVTSFHRPLDRFEAQNVHGTFSVLGWVAKTIPELVRGKLVLMVTAPQSCRPSTGALDQLSQITPDFKFGPVADVLDASARNPVPSTARWAHAE